MANASYYCNVRFCVRIVRKPTGQKSVGFLMLWVSGIRQKMVNKEKKGDEANAKMEYGAM